jgi:phosphatidylglycerol---prolipoprotein diacylglyceryl transferase
MPAMECIQGRGLQDAHAPTKQTPAVAGKETSGGSMVQMMVGRPEECRSTSKEIVFHREHGPILRAMPAPALLAYFVHRPTPFLIRFTDIIGIRYYGLAYLLGFVSAGWLFRRYYRAGRTPLDTQASMDLMLALVAGVLIGGRLGSYLLYDGWRTFTTDPLGIFKVWQGGMASHGGFVGVTIAAFWFARRHKVSVGHIGDLVVSAAPLGLFFGRIANFLNGELWGKPSHVPWAVIFEGTTAGDMPRHPSQLYEAALEGLLLFVLMQWRFWRSDVIKRQPGRLAAEFLIAYAAVRIFCEQFREPDVFTDNRSSLLFGLSRGTFFSFFLIVGGVVLLILSHQRGKKTT